MREARHRIRVSSRRYLQTAVLLFALPASQFSTAQQAPPLSADDVLRNIAAKRFAGQPITLRVTPESLQAAVQELERISGIAFDLDPAIYELAKQGPPGRNALIANQMPWDALLDAVLTEYRLGIAAEDGRLVIRSRGTGLRTVSNPEPKAWSPTWLVGLSASVLAAGVGVMLVVRRRRASRSRARFALDAQAAEDIRVRLLRLLEVEHIYRDEDLSLRRAAARLRLPPHHLSWVVNDVLGMSFSRLVASYRVDEVKNRLRDPGSADLTILDIALAAGFSTKTSFNKVFKAHTGTTPSEFREKI